MQFLVSRISKTIKCEVTNRLCKSHLLKARLKMFPESVWAVGNNNLIHMRMPWELNAHNSEAANNPNHEYLMLHPCLGLQHHFTRLWRNFGIILGNYELFPMRFQDLTAILHCVSKHHHIKALPGWIQDTKVFTVEWTSVCDLTLKTIDYSEYIILL